jgi:hypothetical protein
VIVAEQTVRAPEVWKFIRTGTAADDAATITQRAGAVPHRERNWPRPLRSLPRLLEDF